MDAYADKRRFSDARNAPRCHALLLLHSYLQSPHFVRAIIGSDDWAGTAGGVVGSGRNRGGHECWLGHWAGQSEEAIGHSPLPSK